MTVVAAAAAARKLAMPTSRLPLGDPCQLTGWLLMVLLLLRCWLNTAVPAAAALLWSSCNRSEEGAERGLLIPSPPESPHTRRRLTLLQQLKHATHSIHVPYGNHQATVARWTATVPAGPAPPLCCSNQNTKKRHLLCDQSNNAQRQGFCLQPLCITVQPSRALLRDMLGQAKQEP
jgi:hypothetical protein